MSGRIGGDVVRGAGVAVLACWLLLVALSATAEKAGAGEAEFDEDLPEVVVTATRVRTAIDDLGGGIDVVLPAEELISPTGLADALSSVPGLDVQGSFFGEKPTINIRGMQGQYGTGRTLVLMDGVPVNDLFLNDADLRFFGMAMVDRVEVVRGPGSALYGKTSVGGVINMITRRGRETPVTEASFMGGDYGTIGGTVGHGARVGAFDYFVSADWIKTDGYMKNPDGTERDWDGQSYGASVGWEPQEGSELRVRANVGSGEGERELYLEDTRQENYLVSYRRESQTTPGTVFTARAYANLARQDQTSWKTFGNSGYIDTATYGLQLQQDITVGDAHRLTFGADAQTDDAEFVDGSGSSPEAAAADTTTAAAYVQDRIALADDTELTLGARLDHDDEYGTEVSPRVGLVRKFSEQSKLYASFGKGYRAPSASDLHLPLINFFVVQYQGNPDLEPETHYSVEVGGTCESDPCSVRWSVFYDIGFDAWDYVKDPAPSIVERPQNITEQMTYGLELEVEAKLREDLSLVGSYTFVRPTYHEYDPDPTIEGNIIEDIPQHSGSIGLKWAFAEGFQLEARARSASSRFTDPENNENEIPGISIGKLDGFTVLDLGLGVALGPNVSVSVSVLNTFDTDYSVHGYLDQSDPIREPGRSVYAGMKARF